MDRIDAEEVLVSRMGPKMTLADMDTSVTGSNPVFDDPFATALLGMGTTPGNVMAVTNLEIAGVSDIPQFLDRAELRLLENISGNLVLSDLSVGPRREALSQLQTQVDRMIERLTERLAKKYGVDVGTLQAGVISLDFAEKPGETYHPGSITYEP